MKPVCGKCGSAHWRFVRCDDAGQAEAREQAATSRREAAKVVPVWIHDKDREFRSDHPIHPTKVYPVWQRPGNDAA